MVTKDDIRIERRRDEEYSSTIVEASVTARRSFMFPDALTRQSRITGDVISSRIESKVKDEILDHIYGEKDDAIAALRSALERCLTLMEYGITDDDHKISCGIEAHAALQMTKDSGRVK